MKGRDHAVRQAVRDLADNYPGIGMAHQNHGPVRPFENDIGDLGDMSFEPDGTDMVRHGPGFQATQGEGRCL